jgi:hypothetical protein
MNSGFGRITVLSEPISSEPTIMGFTCGAALTLVSPHPLNRRFTHGESIIRKLEVGGWQFAF